MANLDSNRIAAIAGQILKSAKRKMKYKREIGREIERIRFLLNQNMYGGQAMGLRYALEALNWVLDPKYPGVTAQFQTRKYLQQGVAPAADPEQTKELDIQTPNPSPNPDDNQS